MSDLDFDLNAPAAPSLTLDAAPAAPPLNLDPEADAKVVEEAKKATPVTVEDTPLSPEEQKMVQDFAEKIDLTNSQMILQYGAASQKKLSDFSDSALSRVRTKDMGETGELITKERLEIKGLGKAKYILKPGGTLGDLYTNSDLVYNDDGYFEVDKIGNVAVKDDYMDDIYLGSVFPKYNLAWRNDFNYKGINLGVLFTARIGGICYSATQANMDLYGVSEASAAARDAGGVMINGRDMIDAQKWYQVIGSQSGLPQYYTYSATNVRLQELSLGYTLPSKWFRDKMRMTVSFVGRNLWMIYCKAPFDPEAVASTGMNYQGIDYFMMPSMRNLGFNVKFQF